MSEDSTNGQPTVLHPTIIRHLERLNIDVSQDLSRPAVAILSEMRWPLRSFNCSYHRQRDQLVASGKTQAADWDDDAVLHHSFSEGPRMSVGMRLGQAVMLAEYTGVDPNFSVPWSEDNHFILFLEENPDDPSDPWVTEIDHEQLGEPPAYNATVSQILAILEPQASFL